MWCRRTRQSGFTLVELVLVIVLLGIIGIASTQFIRQGVSIYSDSVGRDKLQQQTRFAIERMNRELRNALPGSVRTRSDATTQCIEFLPIKAAANYLSPVADSAVSTLDVIGLSYVYEAGDLMAVYPIAENNVYSIPSSLGTLLSASTGAGGVQTLTLSAYQFPNESPTRRFFIVNNPVSFCATDNALIRYEGYTMAATLPLPPPEANGALLAESIRLDDSGLVTVFDYTAGTLQRASVIHLDLRFSDTMSLGDEWIRFSQEIFVRNTP